MSLELHFVFQGKQQRNGFPQRAEAPPGRLWRRLRRQKFNGRNAKRGCEWGCGYDWEAEVDAEESVRGKGISTCNTSCSIHLQNFAAM
jgi:hypothetical protein